LGRSLFTSAPLNSTRISPWPTPVWASFMAISAKWISPNRIKKKSCPDVDNECPAPCAFCKGQACPRGGSRSLCPSGSLASNFVIPTGAKQLTLSSRPERSGVEGPCVFARQRETQRPAGCPAPCGFIARGGCLGYVCSLTFGAHHYGRRPAVLRRHPPLAKKQQGAGHPARFCKGLNIPAQSKLERGTPRGSLEG
jgi:hypothetical protein